MPQGVGVGSIYAGMRLDNRRFVQNLRVVNRELVKVGKTSKVTGGFVRDIGIAMAAVGSFSIGVVGKLVASWAQYDHAMRKAIAATQATEVELGSMRQLVVSVSKELNMSVGSLAEIFRQLGYAGVEATESLKAFHHIAKITKAGFMDTASGAKMVINVMKGFRIPFSETERTVETLAIGFSRSVQEMTDLYESLTYVAGTAYAANSTLSELVGTIMIMADAGFKGSRAGVALRRAFANLSAPVPATRKAIEQLGLQVYDIMTGKMRPWSELISEIIVKLKELGDEERKRIVKAIFGVRAITGIEAVTAEGIKGIKDRIKALREETGVLDEMVRRIMETLVEQWGVMKQHANELSRTLGRTLEPAAFKLIKRLSILLQTGTDWVKQNQELTRQILKGVAAVGAFATAIGTLSVGIWLLVPGFKALGLAMLLPFAMLVKLPGILLKVTTALIAMTAPWLAVAAAIAAAGVAIYSLRAVVMQNKKLMKLLWRDIKDIGRWFWGLASNITEWLGSTFENVLAFAKVWAQKMVATIFGVTGAMKHAIQTLRIPSVVFEEAFSRARKAGLGYTDAMKIAWTEMVESMKKVNPWDAFKEGYDEAMETDWARIAVNVISGQAKAIGEATKKALKWLGEQYVEGAKDLWQTFGHPLVRETIQQFKDDVKGLAGFMEEHIPGILGGIKSASSELISSLKEAYPEVAKLLDALRDIPELMSLMERKLAKIQITTPKAEFPKVKTVSPPKLPVPGLLFETQVASIREELGELGRFQLPTSTWVDSIREFTIEARKEFNAVEMFMKDTWQGMTDTFHTFFVDAIRGEIESVEDLFRRFGDTVIDIIARIAANWVAMKVLGGFGAMFGPAKAGIEGPVLGGVQLTAPRTLGLPVSAPPYIAPGPGLQRGTDYIPREGWYHLHEGESVAHKGKSAREEEKFTIVNVLDPSLVPAGMMSPTGRRIILNVVNEDILVNGVTRRTLRGEG